MSGQQLQPLTERETILDSLQDDQPPAEWGGGQEVAPKPKGPSIARYLSALNRFKWLILLFAILGGGGGYTATKFIAPEYEVRATIILEQGAGTTGGSRGPIQAQELLQASGWQDLLRSYAVSDPVVTRLGLFVKPDRDADSTIFRAFGVDQGRMRAGSYSLTITGNRYSLSLKPGLEVETGAIGDSIGRPAGFQWQPSSQLLAGRKEVSFTVKTPRESSIEINKKMRMSLQDGSSFLFISLVGEDAQRTAATLNQWVEQFVALATQLKKQNVTSVMNILEGQRSFSEDALRSAEAELQSFRVRTVTEPNERTTIAPGIEMTNNPVYDIYFRDRILADNYRRDRESLERIVAESKGSGVIKREAVLSIPSVVQDPAAGDLKRVLDEQAIREIELRKLREKNTDINTPVINANAALSILNNVTVPNALQAYLTQLSLREQALNSTVAQSSKDLKNIPARTIEEARLKRQVEVSEELYRNLNLKAAEAKLAEAATIPDVRILDPAVAPISPTRNTAPVIILGAIGAAAAFAMVLAILLDNLDKRFRYPEQATDDLGLFILGVVPVIDSKGSRAAEQASQVVEAFRTIRMNVRYAADPARPLMMTITSPGPNDGKSLISSNLALSFAEGGARTLLIDGDIRRGELAKTFGMRVKPGLVEYLDGNALIAEVLNPSSTHPNLTVMPGGARRRRAPELLATARLNQLMNQMAAEYDVVIVDSPPLGAGFDAFALATATGNMALVMRAGYTDRKMAAAKMATVDTLPVRVMGAILNGIKLTGAYEYYSYYQNYAAHDEEPVGRLTSGSDDSSSS